MSIKKATLPFQIIVLAGRLPEIEKDERYEYFPFRLLSADSIIGAGGWNCSYFPKDVLFKAAEKWEGVPLRIDHKLSTEAIRGNVVGVWVDEGFMQNGVRVPPGVNGYFRLHKTEFSKEIELLKSDPEGIRATSASVSFDFEPSHEFEDEYDFYWHVGETINGEFVYYKGTEIHEVVEQSMVWDGADPCALKFTTDEQGLLLKYLKTENVLTDEQAKALKERIKEVKHAKTEFKKDFGSFKKFARMTFGNPQPKEQPQEQNKSEATTQATEVSFEKLKTALADLAKKEIELEEHKQTVLKLQQQLVEKEQLLNSQAQEVALAKQIFEVKRKHAKEVYTATGKELLPSIEAIIDKADFTALDTLVESWGGQVMTFYSEPSCKNCGSKDFVFRNSARQEVEDTRQKGEGQSKEAEALHKMRF